MANHGPDLIQDELAPRIGPSRVKQYTATKLISPHAINKGSRPEDHAGVLRNFKNGNARRNQVIAHVIPGDTQDVAWGRQLHKEYLIFLRLDS